jgi:hypothetical protein
MGLSSLDDRIDMTDIIPLKKNEHMKTCLLIHLTLAAQDTVDWREQLCFE